VLVALLFAAAALGIGMESTYKLGRLRVAPSTLAFVLLPVPATAWIVVLWSRPMPTATLRIVRILTTLLLLSIAILCASLTFFVLIVRPVSRAS
jgi:hypothetical protein